jgi:hypothetical protein
MGKYEEALACVPQSIMNAEFAALLVCIMLRQAGANQKNLRRELSE